MEVTINSEQFYTRLNKIITLWQNNKEDLWENSNILCIPMGAVKDSDVVYSKSSSIHLYLLGYEFPESLIIITTTTFYFITTQKKAAYLEAIKDDSKFQIKTYYKTKDENSNKDMFKGILNTIKKTNGNTLGTIVKGEFEGRFIPSWNEVVATESFNLVDISRGLGLILSVKDSTELDICKRAAVLTNKVLKHGFITEMEEIIDKDRSETHESIAQKVEGIIYDPSKLGINVSKDVVESCYSPIIQSGGNYDIRISAQSNSEVMKFDVIICSLGARYRNYCANIARTYLIDPVKKILDTYSILMTLTDKCLEQMIIGNELKDVMEGAKNYLNKKAPHLIECLPKTLGFAIGLEFRDSTMLLNSTNTTRFEVGMVFNLIVGLQNIPLTEEDKRGATPSIKKLNSFSLLVADTVVIQAEGVPDVLTKSTRTTSDITYNLADNEDNDQEDNDDENNNGNNNKFEGTNYEEGVRRSTRGKEDKLNAEKAAAHRIQRQKELMEAKILQARRKGRGGGSGDDNISTGVGTDLNTYSTSEEYPKDTNPYRLKVDMQKEAILVPMNGHIVPFHISTVKNVSMPEPDRATYLRINFYSTGMTLGKDVPRNIQQLITKYGGSTFVKELTFRSLDPKNLTTVHRNILELRKRLRQSEQKKEEERDLVEQDKLIRIKDQRAPQLQDLTMRPQLSGRKSTGALAAHQNGLRFTTNKGEIIDVLYANIKHAFFQPCESATMVLVHFHLKDFILIGKKKHKDIQFFTEVIEASLNLDNQKRSAYDPDELDDEQREREMKKKLNKAFLEFCKKVEKVAKHYEFNINFDIPYNDLGFYGTCNREMVYIMPSVSCLVNLTELPFFVVDISEVDHVHFERVTFATKNIDMVIIFKNYETRAISAIEVKYLELIQDWLSDVQITYTSGPDSFQWKAVMDTAKEDDRFYLDTHADGTRKAVGWLMLVEGTQDDEEEEESDEESEYGEDSEEDESDEDSDDDDDSDDESFADEDESDDYEDEEDDLEEEGKTWDELEEDARASDRKRVHEEEDDDAPVPKKKTKGRR